MSIAIDTAPLTRDEAVMLCACESEVERGLATFVRVGNALAAIRDGHLYRATHATFEKYCAGRWNLKRQRAYELIDAAAVAGHLSEISDNQPERESHVAPLAQLPPTEQREAWSEAVKTAPRGSDGKPRVTAHHVKQTVERRQQQVSDATDDQEPLKQPPTFDDATPSTPTSKLQVTVLDAVEAVVRAIRASEPDAARDAAIAALRVLERRRMGTSPEVLAKCVELLLKEIAENAK